MKDIREYKTNLRNFYRSIRQKLSVQDKLSLDQKVFERVLRLNQYATAQLLLVYVSTAIEVDTKMLIEKALADGKRVGVPRCVPGTREMECYEIHSLDELEPGTFGVLEPNPNPEKLLPQDPGGLCIIPGLCFDNFGYRLGYGKGYYDRFLSGYTGVTVGICYSSCVRGSLIHGRFDRPVELLVTDRFIRRTDLQFQKKRNFLQKGGRGFGTK